MNWRDQAKCRPRDVGDIPPMDFFIGYGGERDGNPGAVAQANQTARAKALCAGCPVQDPCLAAALEYSHNQDFGIWGGTTKTMRKTLRKNPDAYERMLG